MMKRFLALLLCFAMMLVTMLGLVACNKEEDPDEEEDLGAIINMYLTDVVYDLDPIHAFYNESSLKVVSLIFDTLFTLDSNGKVKKSLVDEYEIIEDENTNEYKMLITLKETLWSDGATQLSANDVVYTIKRALNCENSSEVACLLYDIKNARAAKHGDVSIDAVGVYAVDQLVVEFTFEGKIDYDAFIMNLCSPALAPLPESIVAKGEDWAKKPATMMCSGPFKVRKTDYTEGEEQLILERNEYYLRDKKKNKIDKYVTPYRIVVDYSMTDEQIKEAYDAGTLFYVGDIPMSLRNTYKDVATITDAISTHTYFLQTSILEVPMTYEEELESIRESERAEETGTETETETKKVTYTATEQNKIKERNELIAKINNINKNAVLFSDVNVRKALSLAIDRNAIAEAVVFAKAATALVPYGLFDEGSAKKSFRAVGEKLLETSADVNAAKALLSNYNTSEYTINITVAAYDEVHVLVAEMVKTAWEALGFNVALDLKGVIPNDDYYKYTDSTPTDICDDLYAETLRSGEFEVIALDYVATTSDAFSMLAPFAHEFAGQGMDMENRDYTVPTHITGFNNEAYNELIEKAFAAETAGEKSEALHEAEKLLIEQMPVIPIIFNQNATLTSKMLSKVQSSFYCPALFKKTVLKDYEKYKPVETTAN